MSALIHVINPNSSTSVTDGIARAVGAPGPSDARVNFVCATLAEAPPGIVTQGDADLAATLVAAYVRAHAHEADGFIIGCYSDPGLFAARELTDKPVTGIGEACLKHAASISDNVGVVAVSSPGIARHWRMYRMLGLAHTICGERAIDLAVADSGDEQKALGRLIDVAGALRDLDGAKAIVLGCAGMADLRGKVENAVGIPVLDPCGVAADAMRTLFADAPPSPR
ncbi:MAG: aspartate/glutamate racemase family protein [Janthinobacterium lividum]